MNLIWESMAWSSISIARSYHGMKEAPAGLAAEKMRVDGLSSYQKTNPGFHFQSFNGTPVSIMLEQARSNLSKMAWIGTGFYGHWWASTISKDCQPRETNRYCTNIMLNKFLSVWGLLQYLITSIRHQPCWKDGHVNSQHSCLEDSGTVLSDDFRLEIVSINVYHCWMVYLLQNMVSHGKWWPDALPQKTYSKAMLLLMIGGLLDRLPL